MNYAVLGIGIVGIVAGLAMTIIGASAREIRDTQLSMIKYGLLIAVGSLVVLFIRKVVVSHRN